MQLADSVRTDILKALQQDKLELPVLPEVALRIRDTADNPNVTVGLLAKVIGEDPALSARVIRVANSPLLRGIRVVRVRMWRSAQAGARAWMYLPLCGMLMWEGNRSR